MLSVFKIAGSALTAQRLRMDVISSNISNAEATNTPEGGPYKKERVVFAPMLSSAMSTMGRPSTASGTAAAGGVQPAGVEVQSIVEDDAAPRVVYDPTHPDANEEGYVEYPNVDLLTEMTDMLSASRAYEASITVINVAKTMAQRALDLGRM